MITGIGFDEIYAKSKTKVSRPTTKSVIKKKSKIPIKRVEKKPEKKKDLTRPKSSSTIKKKPSKDQKPVTKLTPTQKTAVDKKLAKHKALKGKTFKSKKDAETAYRKSLAEQKYDKKPEQRPEHIPESYEYNGRRVQTEFYGGRYGYYESPGVFRPYSTSDFVVDMLVINALTTPRTHTVYSSPIVRDQKPTNENDVKITIMILFFIFIIIAGGVGLYFYFNRRE